jgi:biotin operon repressor
MNTYLNIPYSLLECNKFDAVDKILLAEILSLSKLPKGCIKSDSSFGQLVNLKRSAVNKRMKTLELEGYIQITEVKGKGKRTKPVTNFWQKIKGHAMLEDIGCDMEVQVTVTSEDTSCHQSGTTNTSTITDIILQEELQYTGATVDTTIENIDNQYPDACFKLIELISIDPAQITNPFVKQFQDCLAGLYLFFGNNFIDDCNIFKSNKELYEIYGSSNFYEIRQDLQFVRENMDRILRQKNWK